MRFTGQLSTRRRKSAATSRFAYRCNSAKAILLVRSMVTNEILAAFFSMDFGKINVQVANRVVLKLFLRGGLPVLVQWQAAHAVALKIAVQRRARQVRDSFL